MEVRWRWRAGILRPGRKITPWVLGPGFGV